MGIYHRMIVVCLDQPISDSKGVLALYFTAIVGLDIPKL